MSLPTISDNPHVQAHYELCRAQGTSHTLAEMFALARGPALMTDSVFLAGRGGCYDQFEGSPIMGDFYAREAKKLGVDTTGKVYLKQLADFPGDPRAWVSGRGDVKKLCEERGWGCEGGVKLKVAPATESPSQGGGLASDIVDRLVGEKLAMDPGANVQDVREKVIDQHAPHWAKKEVS